MQVKFEAAMMTCNPNATMEMAGRMLDPTSRRAKKPSKKTSKKPSKKPSRKPSKKPSMKPTAAPICEECLPCPTMQDMEDMMMEKMSTEICVLQAAGWIDAEGNHIQVKTGLEGKEGKEESGTVCCRMLWMLTLLSCPWLKLSLNKRYQLFLVCSLLLHDKPWFLLHPPPLDQGLCCRQG